MNTIYELKNQIYTQVVNETKKVFYCSDNKDDLKKKKKVNFSHDLYLNIMKDKNIELYIEYINVEKNIDNKTSYFGIGFSLFLCIDNKLYMREEKIVYNIIETILKLLYSMDFYYCYKINNCNIKTEIPLTTPLNVKPFIIKISWITNINLDNNLFN